MSWDPMRTRIFPYQGANFWQDWERPINIELFEPDGETAFDVQAGVKIFGNYSRAFDLKSLAILLGVVTDAVRSNIRFSPVNRFRNSSRSSSEIRVMTCIDP